MVLFDNVQQNLYLGEEDPVLVPTVAHGCFARPLTPSDY